MNFSISGIWDLISGWGIWTRTGKPVKSDCPLYLNDPSKGCCAMRSALCAMLDVGLGRDSRENKGGQKALTSECNFPMQRLSKGKPGYKTSEGKTLP